MTACYCDYDAPSVHNVSHPRARKPHICTSCSGAIMPGETYERVWGIWDGEPANIATCSLCEALREWVKAHVPCFCWTYDGLIDNARDTADEYEEACPGLTAELDAKIAKITAHRKASRAALKEAEGRDGK